MSSRVPQYTGALLRIEFFPAKMATDHLLLEVEIFCLVVLAPVEKKIVESISLVFAFGFFFQKRKVRIAINRRFKCICSENSYLGDFFGSGYFVFLFLLS